MRKHYKNFSWLILATAAGLLLYNGLVWQFCTKALLTRSDGVYTGELARMGYLPGYAHARRNTLDLPRRHLGYADYTGQPVDVVVIGDSFSQGVANGPNRFYQDYLASQHNLTVLNLSPHLPGASNFIESVAMLANSGLFDTLKPRYVLLERVERNAYKLARPTDLNKQLSLQQIDEVYRGRMALTDPDEPTRDLPQVGWLNTGNAKWLLYNLLYPFSSNAVWSKVHKVPLTRELFSVTDGMSLLFLYKDLNKFKSRSKQINPELVQRLNANLNSLAQRLRARGIELVFLPAPDKLSLYGPYVAGTPFPPSHFFPLLRQQTREYRWIDAAAILGQALERGERDIYWSDDTHWSWKASELLFAQTDFFRRDAD